MNDTLIRNIQGKELRKMFRKQMNQNVVHLSYKRVKEILHSELAHIDIYGDNSIPKHVEHVFPQSHFKDHPHRVRMKTDMHNLYLCNFKLNTLRNNYRYVDHDAYVENCHDQMLDQMGELVSVKDMFRKTGYMMLINNKKRIFVPVVYSRGMVARSLAYFAVKYDLLDELNELIDINTLVEWNCAEPVNDVEYQKNIICYKHQNSHNPFILYPHMLTYVFADLIAKPVPALPMVLPPPDPLPSIEMLVENVRCLEAENARLEKQVKRLQSELEKYKKD